MPKIPSKKVVQALIREEFEKLDAKAYASRACYYWTLATIAAFSRLDMRAILQAGSASFRFRSHEADDGVSPTHYSYVWEPESEVSKAAILEGRMPELHVWAAIPWINYICDPTTQFLPQLVEAMGEQSDMPYLDMFWGPVGYLGDTAVYRPNASCIRYVNMLGQMEAGRASTEEKFRNLYFLMYGE